MLHGWRRAPHHTTTQTFYFDFSVLLTSSYGKSRVLRRGRVGHESDKCVIVFDANQEYNFIVHAPLQAKDASPRSGRLAADSYRESAPHSRG